MLFKGCLKFKGCFKEVFKGVYRNYQGFSQEQGCFNKVSIGFKEVSGNIQRCLKKVSSVFQLSSFKGILKKFKRCVKEVSKVFQELTEKFQECL